ncbi:histidine kinase [Glaciimonas immobilis]|nr:histidine kinase [Glaciimonas immobilis]KAF3998218.1 histidine kinase [Glaciimonas immobilis]
MDPQQQIVIPDCCNLGVVCRTLIAVNAVLLAKTLLRGIDFSSVLMQFVESSMLVELACFVSLFVLCGIGRLAYGLPLWAQRLLCAVVPAVVTGSVVLWMSRYDWFLHSFMDMSLVGAVLIAAFFGIALQHYFELRGRAFSPVLVEARLQALQARIRPHFLFNSLNAVLSLIRTEPRRAEAALEDLADLIRVLMRDPRAMTTLENELQLCRQYLTIENIRLGDRLKVQWEREGMDDEVISSAQIPTLLLQPLVENAVHYGVQPSASTSVIRIQLKRRLERIEIVVTNPYHSQTGEALSDGSQMALKNIRERLALLYDVEGQLTTAIVAGQFEVRVRFPYMKTQPIDE